MTPQDCATLSERLTWLVNLRWLVVIAAAAGVAVGAVFYTEAALWAGLAAVTAVLCVMNVYWHGRLKQKGQSACQGAIVFTSRQILADFTLLAVSCHLTGGLAGPLTPLFILHFIFSAILLPIRHTIRLIVLATVLMAGSLLLNIVDVWSPVWLFDYHHVKYHMAGQMMKIVFLMIGTFGATAIGLDVSRTLRRRRARIASLVHELEQRNRALKRVDEQRLRLLGVASHDLKSPLSLTEMKIDMLLDGYYGSVSEVQRAELLRMREKIVSLRHFINDMLDMTAMESSGASGAAAEEKKPVDVAAMVRSAVEELKDVALKNNLAINLLVPDEPLVVSGQERRLGRIWQNLISNAIKYGAGGGRVEVSCRAADTQAIVTVTDHGIGIPFEDQANLFHDFFRAKNARAKKIPGTGLGLSIVKRIVESNGGTISVKSASGQGAAFTVRLPLLQPPAQPPPAQPAK